jgi:hypothetical protein
MGEAGALDKLVRKAFAMSGQSVPLGFAVERIAPAVSQLPGGLDERLRSLFASVWPSDSFHVGRIELFGPERIHKEHDDLLPGCLVVRHGFLGIGSDGAGTIFCYRPADGRVYLIPHEYVSEEAVYARPWTKLEANAENIAAIADESWDSLAALFEWAFAELLVIESQGATE